MSNASRYAAILVWGSVALLGANVQTVRADGDHGGMMGGHMCKMCKGHDQNKEDEHSSHDLKQLLKHGKEIGLTSEQISKLKTMQLDLSRAQARAEADIKVATLELHALVEDEQADSAAIQAKVDQLKKAEGGLLFTAIKSRRDAMAILSPEQREKAHAMRDKMMDNMMEKMMGGEDQHTGGMSGMKGGGTGKVEELGKREELGKKGELSTNIRPSAQPQDRGASHEGMNDLKGATGNQTVHHASRRHDWKASGTG